MERGDGKTHAGTASANAMGIVALALWSMNVAVTRQIGEAHPYGMPGLSFALAGAVLVGLDLARGKPPPWKTDASPLYWLLGGLSYVGYFLLYIEGIVYSESRAAVMPLGLINYFWPCLILVLMPFFFHQPVRRGVLAAGMALCVTGVGCALLWGMSWTVMAGLMREIWPACLIMAAAAFLWAFYSNATRKWGGTANGVGWFFLVSGVCLLALWRLGGGPLGLTADLAGPILVHSLVLNALSYMLWDIAVRRGDIGLMGTLANFLPIASVLFGCRYLGEPVTAGLLIGGVLVTAGAVLCRKATVR